MHKGGAKKDRGSAASARFLLAQGKIDWNFSWPVGRAISTTLDQRRKINGHAQRRDEDAHGQRSQIR
jgi:hypothetical protein